MCFPAWSTALVLSQGREGRGGGAGGLHMETEGQGRIGAEERGGSGGGKLTLVLVNSFFPFNSLSTAVLGSKHTFLRQIKKEV